MKAKEADVNYLLEWFHGARLAGMSDEEFNNMLDHISPGCTTEELATVEEWLVKHYPNWRFSEDIDEETFDE